MSDTIELPHVLDIVAAPLLLESFLSRRRKSLSVGAGQVQRLGAQCLQILMAARATWSADGFALEYRDPSSEFIASLELLGSSISKLSFDAENMSGESKL